MPREVTHSKPRPRRRSLARVVHPAPPGAEPILDVYHQPVTETRHRLRGCLCAVPCLGFTCASSLHRGSRATPWCCGGDDYADMAVLVDVEVKLLATYLDGDAPVERCCRCWSKHQGLQQALARQSQETAHAA